MKDLAGTLEERARRVAPSGSDQLRQRVALSLADEGSRRRRRRTAWTIAVAAAVATAVVIAVPLVVLGWGSDDAPAVTQPDPTVANTPDPTVANTPDPTVANTPDPTVANTPDPTVANTGAPPTTEAVPEVYMERVLEGSSFEHHWMTSVAVGGPGLVAGGAAFDGYYHDAAGWISRDARTWERVADDPAVFGDEASANGSDGLHPNANQLITDLVSGPLGVMAVGAEGKPGDLDAAVWVSPDGLTWKRVPHDEEVFGGEGDQTIRSVVQTASGAVAVGASGGHAAAWVTSDGSAWTRARIERTDSDDASELNDVAVGDFGLVAVGGVDLDWDNSGLGSSTPRPTAEPAMWLSTDGTVWNRAPDPTAESESGVPPTGSLTVIAAGRGGVVAIGEGSVGPVVWASQDGSEWHTLDAEFLDESTAFHAVVEDLAWDSDRLVAVGGYQGTTPGYGWAPIRVVIWVSLDGGTTWHMGSEVDIALGEAGINDTPLPSPARLAPFGSSFVVVGNDAIPTEHDINGYIQHARNAAVWLVNVGSAGQ
jgi:hypothetical protein